MDAFHFVINKNTLISQSKLVDSLLKGTSSLKILNDKKGLLFSDTILENYIDVEEKHQKPLIALHEKRKLRTFSSGEQKKVLLNYLIKQKPDFLILDSLFESLDSNSIKHLKETLIQHSKSIKFIQIYSRKDEILSIVTHVLLIKNDEITNYLPISEYRFKENTFQFKNEIPKAITNYQNIAEKLIVFKNVSVSYSKKCVLKNINFTINKNEFWQFIGPNGSGKTTILSMIYGNNVKAYGQEVYLFGNKKGTGESVWEIKEKIGYFSPAILELFKRKITTEHMLLSGFYDSIGLYKTPTSLEISQAQKWMELLKIKNDFFQNLTASKQRLVLIARAMIKHPPLLILDEPFTNLDEKGTNIVASLINKIAKESTTTVVFVSHRKIKDLQPKYTLYLTPTEKGSLSSVKIEC